uniref:HisS family protein n=5 Tax=uncultured Helicobacter sp. TaxID=175537 RepID=UPI0026E9B207
MALVTPRTLSGFRDRLPKEALAKTILLNKLSAVFMSFGFVPIETPHLEYADVLVKQGSDEIQKELYRFKDHGGRDVALRFDLTVPLARFVSQYKNEVDLPFKRFAIGNVFRGERAQRGRYREFTQCDFDFIGSDSISCDAEILQVIYASLVGLGIDEFTIWLNHRSILNGICEYCGVSGQKDINSALRIIDKLDKIGKDGVG